MNFVLFVVFRSSPSALPRQSKRKPILSHRWRGNVRKLENAVERAVVLARGERIGPEDLLLDAAVAGEGAAGETLQEHLDRATAEHVARILEATGGQRAEAARRLGVDRSTLYRLMRRLGF